MGAEYGCNDGVCASTQQCILDSDVTCSICLEVCSETPMKLNCGHWFCQPCLAQHVAFILQARQEPWCPLCRCKLSSGEVSVLCPFTPSISDLTPAEPRSLLSEVRDRRANRSFKRACRKHHFKRCPNCQVVIQKDGGCDHMTCQSCTRPFSWESP